MEVENKEFNEDDTFIPNTEEETSFSQQTSTEVFTQPVAYDPVEQADKILQEHGLPDIDTIIANKGKDKDIDKRLFAKIIEREKPRDESGIKRAIKTYNQEINDESTTLPSVPSDTPSVPLDVQNRIDLKLTELDISENIDHLKFMSLESGGLAVKTSEGSKTITQKGDPRLFSERPGIPFQEYESIFGIDRKEYASRVRARNNVVRDYIQSRTTETIRLTTQEIYNPAFEDPDQSLIPMPEGESSEWQKQSLGAKLKSGLIGVVNSMSKTIGDVLARPKPTELDMADPEEDVEMLDLSTDQRNELEQMYGRLRELNPELGTLIDDMNTLATEIREETDTDKKAQLTTDYDEKKTTLDAKLDELDKIKNNKNVILKLLGVGAATTGIAGLLTGIFEAVANALGSEEAKDLLPKSSDPKDIAASGLGKAVIKRLTGLAAYFHDKYVNSSGTLKAFWRMMENAVEFIQDHLWILIASILALATFEINKR